MPAAREQKCWDAKYNRASVYKSRDGKDVSSRRNRVAYSAQDYDHGQCASGGGDRKGYYDSDQRVQGGAALSWTRII